MFLVRETWMRLVYKFLVPSFSYEFLIRETWTVCHQLYWRWLGDISSKNNSAQKAKSFTLRRTYTIDVVAGTRRSPSNSTVIQNAPSNRWRIGRLINLVATQYAHPSASQLLHRHIFQPFKLCAFSINLHQLVFGSCFDYNIFRFFRVFDFWQYSVAQK